MIAGARMSPERFSRLTKVQAGDVRLPFCNAGVGVRGEPDDELSTLTIPQTSPSPGGWAHPGATR